MGIRFACPNGHRLNVKSFLAGKRGICPDCGARFTIPSKTVPGTKNRARVIVVKDSQPDESLGATAALSPLDATAAQAIPVAEPVKFGGSASVSNSATHDSQPAANRQPAAPEPPNQCEQQGGAKPLTASDLTTGSSADYLDASRQTEWFVQITDGQRFGPANTATIHEWICQGRVAPNNLVYQCGWPSWKTATQVFPELCDSHLAVDEASSSSLVLDGRSSRTDRYLGRQAAKSRLFAIVATLGITSAALLAALIYVVRQ